MKLTQDEMHELEILTLLREKDFDHNTCDNSYIDLVMKSGKKAFKIIKKQQKEIKRLYKDNFRLDRENQLKFERAVDTSDYVSKDKIREKIKELKDNRPYLSKFDDWKEKEYTNEDINNMCVEVLEELLGE